MQNGQGFAVLSAAMLAALVGTVSTCLTGPVNAIISAWGERQRHYTAGFAAGGFALAFGLFAPVIGYAVSRLLERKDFGAAVP